MLPKISVCMVSYNQASLIRKAVDSVLMQEGPFRVQLVIGDDCSQDGTADILADYARQHPDIITFLPGEKNVGPNLNFLRVYRACDGEYLAQLEGDDYWLTSGKLAKQLAFLDEHPEFIGCGHRVYHVDQGERILDVFPPKAEPQYNFAALAERNPFATCSVIYRRKIVEYPEWLKIVPCGDWPLHLLYARLGPLGMLPEILGAYRIHPQGAWSAMSAVKKLEKTMSMFDHILPEFEGEQRAAVVRSQRCHRLDLAYALAEAGQRAEAKEHFRLACRPEGNAKKLPPGKVIVVWLGVYLAPVYWPIRKLLRKVFSI